MCDEAFAHGGVDGATLRKMAGAVRVLLDGIGESADREGLVDTPRRVAKALLLDLTKGSRGMTWQDVVGTALFHEDHVATRDLMDDSSYKTYFIIRGT